MQQQRRRMTGNRVWCQRQALAECTRNAGTTLVQFTSTMLVPGAWKSITCSCLLWRIAGPRLRVFSNPATSIPSHVLPHPAQPDKLMLTHG